MPKKKGYKKAKKETKKAKGLSRRDQLLKSLSEVLAARPK